jgi:hypothetical protein
MSPSHFKRFEKIVNNMRNSLTRETDFYRKLHLHMSLSLHYLYKTSESGMESKVGGKPGGSLSKVMHFSKLKDAPRPCRHQPM